MSFKAELAQLSEGTLIFFAAFYFFLTFLPSELQSQRDTISRLREENRRTRSDYDELQLRYDDEVYNSGGWKKEKERLETKITDINKAYEAAIAAQTEQQSQIVSLHSQVRELRSVLDDAEADRALLQKARRALQAELETIKLDHVDTNKMSSETEFQKLQLQKQDLERLLEEQRDRADNALDRMKKAEIRVNDCQVELGKIRVENVELDKLNVGTRALVTYAFAYQKLLRLILRSKSKTSTSGSSTWRQKCWLIHPVPLHRLGERIIVPMSLQPGQRKFWPRTPDSSKANLNEPKPNWRKSGRALRHKS